jgi:hypothetical protein
VLSSLARISISLINFLCFCLHVQVCYNSTTMTYMNPCPTGDNLKIANMACCAVTVALLSLYYYLRAAAKMIRWMYPTRSGMNCLAVNSVKHVSFLLNIEAVSLVAVMRPSFFRRSFINLYLRRFSCFCNHTHFWTIPHSLDTKSLF